MSCLWLPHRCIVLQRDMVALQSLPNMPSMIAIMSCAQASPPHVPARSSDQIQRHVAQLQQRAAQLRQKLAGAEASSGPTSQGPSHGTHAFSGHNGSGQHGNCRSSQDAPWGGGGRRDDDDSSSLEGRSRRSGSPAAAPRRQSDATGDWRQPGNSAPQQQRRREPQAAWQQASSNYDEPTAWVQYQQHPPQHQQQRYERAPQSKALPQLPPRAATAPDAPPAAAFPPRHSHPAGIALGYQYQGASRRGTDASSTGDELWEGPPAPPAPQPHRQQPLEQRTAPTPLPLAQPAPFVRSALQVVHRHAAGGVSGGELSSDSELDAPILPPHLATHGTPSSRAYCILVPLCYGVVLQQALQKPVRL